MKIKIDSVKLNGSIWTVIIDAECGHKYTKTFDHFLDKKEILADARMGYGWNSM